MLPKSERLRKDDFISTHPKVFFRGEYFDVASTTSLHYKFACVISKKRIKTAIARNKVKRRIFNGINEIFLQNTSLPKEKQQHIIFYPKSTAQSTDYQILHKEISKVFATLQ